MASNARLVLIYKNNRKGDYVIYRGRENGWLLKIDEIKYVNDPGDMWFTTGHEVAYKPLNNCQYEKLQGKNK